MCVGMHAYVRACVRACMHVCKTVQKLAYLEAYQIHSESCDFLCQVGQLLRSEGGGVGQDLGTIQVGLEQSI